MSAKSEVLNVQLREQTGTTASVRLRSSGLIPAVLYGHGEANRHLAIPRTEVSSLLRHHGRTVQLAGAVSDTALISQIQYDHLGIEVLHLDLIRVNLKEKVDVEVAIAMHGEPIGVRNGGVLLDNTRAILIRCSAGSIPETVVLDISDLDLGQQKTAADITLPAGVELAAPPETVVVRVERLRGAAATDAGEEGEAEEEA